MNNPFRKKMECIYLCDGYPSKCVHCHLEKILRRMRLMRDVRLPKWCW